MAPKDILVSCLTARFLPDDIAPLADHGGLLSQYCARCDLRLSDPAEESQSFLTISNSPTYRALINYVKDWNSKATRGCLLCDLVRAVANDLGRAHNDRVADELQLRSLGDYRRSILLAGFRGEGPWKKELWEVELCKTEGSLSLVQMFS